MSNSKLDAEYYNNNLSRQKLLAGNILPTLVIYPALAKFGQQNKLL